MTKKEIRAATKLMRLTLARIENESETQRIEQWAGVLERQVGGLIADMQIVGLTDKATCPEEAQK